MVAETLAELRAALHDIEEKRRIEQERAEKQRQIATFIGTARAAIKAGRFSAALDALASARGLDESAEGLAELTEQAHRGQAGEIAAPPREDDRLAADADATRFIVVLPGKKCVAPSRPRKRGTRPPPTTVTTRRTADQVPPRTLKTVDTGKPWVWILIVAAAVLLVLGLVMLYRQGHPTPVGFLPGRSRARAMGQRQAVCPARARRRMPADRTNRASGRWSRGV